MGRFDFLSVLRPRRVGVTTQAASEGGAVARAERQASAHELGPTTPPRGAGVDPHAPKAGPPSGTRVIDAEAVTTEITVKPRRPPVDLNPSVRPLARGAGVLVGGAGIGLAALGLSRAAEAAGEAVYTAGEEQRPYTQPLPDGGFLYSDPVTGETYVIVRNGEGAGHQDANGPEGIAPGGYSVVEVTEGERADAEAQKDAFSGLFNPWVLLGLLALLAVVLIIAAKRRPKAGGK